MATAWPLYRKNRKNPLAPSTLEGYTGSINKHLLPAFGNHQMADIGPLEILKCLDSLPVSRRTASNIHSLLRTMFKAAKSLRIVPVSPMLEVERPSFERWPKPTLDAETIKALIAECGSEYELLTTLMFVAPVRLGEALALRWMDWEPETRTVHFRHSYYRHILKAPKTHRSVRTFVLHPAVAALFSQKREQSNILAETEWVFDPGDGRPLCPDYLRKRVLYPAMDRLRIKSGLRTHGFHIFRHWAGSIIHRKTRDIKLVSAGGPRPFSNIDYCGYLCSRRPDRQGIRNRAACFRSL